MTLRRFRAMLFALGCALFAALSCVTPSSDPRFVAQPPDRETFDAVSALLASRCGTMDCHGVTYRNLRVYSGMGLRLSPEDRPTSKAGATTLAELDATYTSLVALEPEMMSRVVAEGGSDPQRLTLVRKARGAEQHAGGSLWHEGDLADRCLTTWLAGTIDLSACEAALRKR